MAEPIVMKEKGQTDQKIVNLSAKAFKKAYGFTPKDKIEQRHFANTGERLTDPDLRKGMEQMEAFRKQASERRAGA